MNANLDLARNVGGLVLAGGASSRFGTEKAAAAFDGATMLDAVTKALGSCAAVAVSAKPGAAAAHAASLGLDVVADDPRHPSGPLAGVLAGLAWAEARGFTALVTAPCDTPRLPHDLAARLLAALEDAPAAFAVTGSGEHPLCAVWRTDLAAPLRAELDVGRHPATHFFLSDHGAKHVLFEDAAGFANVNTPDELARLQGGA